MIYYTSIPEWMFIWLSHLRFDKGFNNLRERTSCFRHFYLVREPKLGHKTQMVYSFGYWKLFQPFNDLNVHQNIAIHTCRSVWGYGRGWCLFSSQDLQWLINSRFCPYFCSILWTNSNLSALPHPQKLLVVFLEQSVSGIYLYPH